MAFKTFIVVMRDQHMRLVGPFEDDNAACVWACEPNLYGDVADLGQLPATNNPTDDPRWQTIQILEELIVEGRCFEVQVVAPTEGPMPE